MKSAVKAAVTGGGTRASTTTLASTLARALFVAGVGCCLAALMPFPGFAESASASPAGGSRVFGRRGDPDVAAASSRNSMTDAAGGAGIKPFADGKRSSFSDECQSSDDCGEGQCCVVGMTRYSVPTCQPLGDRGDTCRPHTEPENVTLWYPQFSPEGEPTGVESDFTNVYRILCPCDARRGLVCNRREGACS